MIYIDSNYCCHTTNVDGTLRAVDTSIFDGKCAAYIEGYRFVPSGESWTRSDGVVFAGAMVSPCKDPELLMAYQEQYEKDLQKIQELTKVLEAAGVTV